MTQVVSFLSFLWVIFIVLSPCFFSWFIGCLECTLMLFLKVKCRILEYFFVFINDLRRNFLQLLWVAQPSIKHSLIISYQWHFSWKSLIPMILWFPVNIISFFKWSSMALVSSGMILDLRVMSKVIIKCSLMIGWLIHWF